MILGIVAVVCVPVEEEFTEDEIYGLFIFSVLSIVFAAIALHKRQRGRGMAIAGLVLGILGFLGFLGTL